MNAARGGSGSCSCSTLPLRSTWERYAADLGCGEALGNGRLAWQPVEGGQILWVVRSDGGPDLISVINGRSLQGPVWGLYVDSYVDGEPAGTDELLMPGSRPSPSRSGGSPEVALRGGCGGCGSTTAHPPAAPPGSGVWPWVSLARSASATA